jgi:hypothetical protein
MRLSVRLKAAKKRYAYFVQLHVRNQCAGVLYITGKVKETVITFAVSAGW